MRYSKVTDFDNTSHQACALFPVKYRLWSLLPAAVEALGSVKPNDDMACLHLQRAWAGTLESRKGFACMSWLSWSQKQARIQYSAKFEASRDRQADIFVLRAKNELIGEDNLGGQPWCVISWSEFWNPSRGIHWSLAHSSPPLFILKFWGGIRVNWRCMLAELCVWTQVLCIKFSNGKIRFRLFCDLKCVSLTVLDGNTLISRAFFI